ncbi:LysE family transporter [Gilliamella apicola]|uniref:Lysine transporter LysE n=1 Tax=Gilliamella apicola TaxID=1196095 RepID=A0A2V4DVJ7_9GAMM|nr:LysE family transporter [Gilliamella apicola]PXZ04732.1 lysine transporter LysE [Gilliamella apicola]
MNVDTLILVITISCLGMISPGPDFFLVLKNSLSYPRKMALMTCLGVISAIAIHMCYCVAGIAMLISATPWLYNTLRYAGAAYLLWIGIKALLAKSSGTTYVTKQTQAINVTAKKAFMQGLLCNILNPKATLFFLAIFTQLLNANSTMMDKFMVASIIWLEALLWWPLVVFIFQTQVVQRRYFKLQAVIDKLLGVILIVLGVKVALGF